MGQNTRGFTIVELLIVIVVIAILAAISMVAYTNIQNRAYDTRTKDAAAKFERALRLWSVDTSERTLKGNSGSTAAISNGNCVDGGGSGFVGSGNYLCTTEDILRSAGYLPTDFVKNLPANTYFGGSSNGARAVMIYQCGGDGKYILYWTLREPTAEDTSNLSNQMTSCGTSTSSNIVTLWGMRAAKIVQL